jgi:hypothetical protein
MVRSSNLDMQTTYIYQYPNFLHVDTIFDCCEPSGWIHGPREMKFRGDGPPPLPFNVFVRTGASQRRGARVLAVSNCLPVFLTFTTDMTAGSLFFRYSFALLLLFFRFFPFSFVDAVNSYCYRHMYVFFSLSYLTQVDLTDPILYFPFFLVAAANSYSYRHLFVSLFSLTLHGSA